MRAAQVKGLPVPSEMGKRVNASRQKPAVRSGGLASAAVQAELDGFASRQSVLSAEWAFLRYMPTTGKRAARLAAKLAELRERNQQLMLDLIAWMRRNGAMVVIFALIAACATGCAPFHWGKLGGDW